MAYLSRPAALGLVGLWLLGCRLLPFPPGGAAPSPAVDPPSPVRSVPAGPTAEPRSVDDETLQTLRAALIPLADPVDLARRLGGVDVPIPDTLDPPAAPRQVGERDTFWVLNGEDENIRVRATLQYLTEHAYFWIEDGVRFDLADLRRLADRFEGEIYPTTRAFFGSEWTPGIDGDPHIYILYARQLGIDVAGYFSSIDSLHPLVRATSNAHEMFVFNADNVDLAEPFTFSVLAHEFQHMIHWNVDFDEVLWINEGLSELAVHLNRLGTAEFHPAYTSRPQVSLNDWPNQEEAAIESYGAASLFIYYFYSRFGPELTQALAAHPANGLEGLDAVLAEQGVVDPLNGQPITVEAAVLDWATANYLDDDSLLDGRFGYFGFDSFLPASDTATLDVCPAGPTTYTVNQFAPHYIRLACPGHNLLEFDGAETTRLLATEPHSGRYAWWSNKADHADMRLTQTFDFSGVEAPIEMTYWMWYDIEQDWDYVYLVASRDGQTWEFIETPSGTDHNPTGNNYGWGYTGVAPGSGWFQETVDLSAYAGKPVTLRFEYVEDAGVNGEGMLLDDLAIPALDYFSDFERDSGGWTAEGWVRVRNLLPQSFQLAWITLTDPPTVEYLPLETNNLAYLTVVLGEGQPEGVLVVVPTTRYTRQPASYTLRFLSP